eukprot:4953297-Prymnesium_polylepis.1
MLMRGRGAWAGWRAVWLCPLPATAVDLEHRVHRAHGSWYRARNSRLLGYVLMRGRRAWAVGAYEHPPW